MLKNYFRSLYRNFVRNKFYTIFNIIGLATGLTAALLILFYIQDELSFDQHYKNSERIYRLESAFTVNNNEDLYATFPIPLGPALKNEIPEIEEVVRIHFADEMLFSYQEKQFFEWSFCYADSSLFDVFSHQFVKGNPNQCLKESNSIVLTESIAMKYFGDEDPMGKILINGLNEGYRVTGLIRDIPANTHLKYDALISMSTLPEIYSTTKPSRFWRVILYTYVLINEQSSIEQVHEKFIDFYIRNMEPLGKQYNVSFEMMSTPLPETHFRQGLLSEQPSGNKSYLIIFSAIALFIILIAAINYMNMATARSANRAKEVGVRKVLGADRKQLIWQFMGESFVLSMAALVLAISTVWFLIPGFNEFTGKEIEFNFTNKGFVFLAVTLVAFLTGILSGSYPAFFLSSFNPAAVLKGHVSRTGAGSRNLRKVLVSVQFFLAVFMVIASLVVTDQLDFLKEKDLGFNPDQVVLLQVDESVVGNRIESFKQELLQHSSIQSVSNSFGIPGIIRWILTMRIEQEDGMNDRAILYMETDFDFCSTYQLELISGRDFNPQMGTDSLEAVLINETAASEFGWTEDAIGKKIHFGYGQDGTGGRMLKVIGVVKDFNFRSLHNAIEPVIMLIQDSPGDLISIRLQEENRSEALAFMEEKWDNFGINEPFRYENMEDRLGELYADDEKIGVIIQVGTLFTILLALLGLLGLSSFVAEQKTKEIGIRKIHGATVSNVLTYLYRDFISLFIIAFIAAVPIAWWRLNKWLESEFIYFQDIQWLTFFYAGLVSFAVGLAAISYFIIRAARSNPVDAIKYE